MSSGTFIIQSALSKLGVHSAVSPAVTEAITTGKDTLNSFVAQLEDDGIITGMVPLESTGSELSEPLGARNIVIDNLAILMAPYFPGAVVSNDLQISARKGMNYLKVHYKTIIIPKPVARSTLPKGQGNSYPYSDPFFAKGEEIG